MSFKKRLWWWFMIGVAFPVLLVLDSKHPIETKAELYGTLAVYGSFSVALFWMIVVMQEDF